MESEEGVGAMGDAYRDRMRAELQRCIDDNLTAQGEAVREGDTEIWLGLRRREDRLRERLARWSYPQLTPLPRRIEADQ